MHSTRDNARALSLRGFTIVEILVTVAIIAILMGLLISGVRGAMGSARKTRELNSFRGAYAAWSQYATNYDEAILPGYLSEQTQSDWKVHYSDVAGTALATSLTQTYPWRLARYLDDPVTTLTGYYENDGDELSEPSVEWDGGPAHPSWMDSSFGQPSSLVAYQPAFSYNAYYIGGWYKGATPVFADAAWTNAASQQMSGGLVCTRLANIHRTDQTIVFAGGTLRDVGHYKASANPEDRIPGNAWITPPMLGSINVWEPFMGIQQGVSATASMAPAPAPSPLAPQGATDTGSLQVNVVQGVPCRRHNGKVAIVAADGHTESMGIGTLMDMRNWIDAADQAEFTHADN